MSVHKKRLFAVVVLVGCCIIGLGLHNTVYNRSTIRKEVSLLVERLVEGSSHESYADKLLTNPANGLAVQQGNMELMSLCYLFYLFWLVCSFALIFACIYVQFVSFD